jgi:hypothetical protein
MAMLVYQRVDLSFMVAISYIYIYKSTSITIKSSTRGVEVKQKGLTMVK